MTQSTRTASGRRWWGDRRHSETSPDLTPLIDVVFQLLIFFVVTAAFLQDEKALSTPLPTDRGPEPQVEVSIPLATIELFLEWVTDGDGGHCVARTLDYEAPDGHVERAHQFPTKRPSGKGTLKHVDYPHPDFRDLRKYLERRKSSFGELDYDVPVTIHYGNSVPVQMVTSVFDCCIEVGLTECALAADEVE